MKKLFFILSLALLVGVGCSKNTSTVEVPKDWKEYKDEEYGFTLKYPDFYVANTENRGEKISFSYKDDILLVKFMNNREKNEELLFATFSPENINKILESFNESEIGYPVTITDIKKNNFTGKIVEHQSDIGIPAVYYLVTLKNKSDGTLILSGTNLDNHEKIMNTLHLNK